jgi:NAD(P)-dependent dehydrogenase (short-subunit alcohol dehydrogenase family)
MDELVLLTGATGKFGHVLTRHLVSQGWTVVATSRDPARVAALTEGFPVGAVVGVVADLLAPDGVDVLVDDLAQRGLAVTHLVNNARSLSSLAVQASGLTRRQDFLAELDMNVVVPYTLATRLASDARHRLRNVVNVGSMYGLVAPNPALYEGSLVRSPVQYGVSKAALHHLTRELAVRLSPQGVRVNCVAFGGVEGRVDEGFLNRYAALAPAGRMLREPEVVGPVDFLLSEASSAVQGHVLVADGGWSIW